MPEQLRAGSVRPAKQSVERKSANPWSNGPLPNLERLRCNEILAWSFHSAVTLTLWRSPPREPLSRRAPASEQVPHSPPATCSQGSGSHAEGPANSSSLLFSWTGVNSLVHLAFHGFTESVFPFLVEGDAIHADLLHTAVI